MRTYTNPIAQGGDFADPFVLRFNGRYYLHCTNPDLRCWSSTDLLHWTLEGPTIAPGTFGDLVPFAPEVTYDNGVFHLYTSPSGTGHRILRSKRPTGPFVPVTGNLGHAIDGHVFVDDDGRRYFYWAGDEGIWGCEMASPTELGEPVLTGAFMHGWTEGPFVMKRDGRYHMTLTGNHYLSPGYRINAAVSDHPLHGYRDSPLNPILLSTTPGHLGLGHSSSVLGPDLVSTYLVYHNLNPDRTRDLNIDRQIWDGDLLSVLGPSRLAPAPAAPDHCTTWGADESVRWEVTGSLVEHADTALFTGPGQLVWSLGRLTDCFTSEHTISATAQEYGIRATDGWRIEIDAAANQLRVLDLTGRTARQVGSANLPAGHRHDVLHCYRLAACDGAVTVFLDNCRVLDFSAPNTTDGRLGYHCGDGTLHVGYTALTHTVERRADTAAVHPVPGRFLPGPSSQHCLLVAAPGQYDLWLSGRFPADSTVRVAVADQTIDLAVPQEATAVFAQLSLDAGVQLLTVSANNQPIGLSAVSLTATPPPWTTVAQPQECSGTGKLLTGAPTTGDWSFSTTVSFDLPAADSHADLIFCARELAEGGEGDDPLLGVNFLIGYSLQFHVDRIVLARHAYDERAVAQVAAVLPSGRPQRVVIARRGSLITARVGDLDELVFTDPWPHPDGWLGLRTRQAQITLEAVQDLTDPWTGQPAAPDPVLTSTPLGQPNR